MIVDRDVELLKFMSQWRFMGIDQASRFLGVQYRVGARRVAGLYRAGLVSVSVPFADRRKYYWVNRDGLSFLNVDHSRLNKALGPVVAQFEHDRILLDIALAFREAQPSFTIFGELGMRRSDMLAMSEGREPRFALKRWKYGRFVNMFPDMVAVSNDRHFYIEYEHTRKDRGRMRSLMNEYINSDRVTAAKYYASPRAYPQLLSLFQENEMHMPLVGGKPKVQVQLHEVGE